MTIFRAYDIRGIYPAELDEKMAFKIGAAIGSLFGGTICVGCDVRTSSPGLKKELISGILSAGADVVDIGVVTTPMVYFAVAYYGHDGGVNVSASHNPKEYNGFKICKAGGVCLSYETGLNKIEELTKTGKLKKGKGRLEKKNIEADYIDFVTKNVKLKNPLKVVIDAGNGAAFDIGPKVFKRLGFEVVKLFCEPDGRFPNHQPDPIKKETLRDLQKRVLLEKADLGIAYDGDGDRVGVVDERGNVIDNNKIFGLLVKNVLETYPKSKIVHEVLVSKIVEDLIRQHGGIPIISKVGHSYVQQKVIDENCIFGGEYSGHYFFKESYGYDDGVFASIKIAELLNKGSISALAKTIPEYITSEAYRPFCEDKIKFAVVDRLKNRLKGHNIIDIDGVRCVFDKSWFIIRASNTGPQLVVRWEAEDKKEFERIGHFVKEQLNSVGIKL